LGKVIACIEEPVVIEEMLADLDALRLFVPRWDLTRSDLSGDSEYETVEDVHGVRVEFLYLSDSLG
jgi:hypothetical protein